MKLSLRKTDTGCACVRSRMQCLISSSSGKRLSKYLRNIERIEYVTSACSMLTSLRKGEGEGRQRKEMRNVFSHGHNGGTSGMTFKRTHKNTTNSHIHRSKPSHSQSSQPPLLSPFPSPGAHTASSSFAERAAAEKLSAVWCEANATTVMHPCHLPLSLYPSEPPRRHAMSLDQLETSFRSNMGL